MARHYQFVFVRAGNLITETLIETLIGQGNTRRSAERSARRAPRRLGHDPRDFYTRQVRHVRYPDDSTVPAPIPNDSVVPIDPSDPDHPGDPDR